MCRLDLQLSFFLLFYSALFLKPICCLWKPHQTECVCVYVCFFQAKGKERQWLKNQALGELDDAKIIDGLTGEKAIYKRRGELDPEVCVCMREIVAVYWLEGDVCLLKCVDIKTVHHHSAPCLCPPSHKHTQMSSVWRPVRLWHCLCERPFSKNTSVTLT